MGELPTIAAIGAGRMGRGIAVAFAYSGHSVRLLDVKQRTAAEFADLKSAVEAEVSSTLNMLSGFGLLDAEQATDALSRVSTYPSGETAAALNGVHVAFEGVPEILDLKKQVLSAVSGWADRDTVIASTTSTILSDELQPSVVHPERFLNAHWLNPAFLVPLVELSPARQTDHGVTARLKDLLESIGKVPVICAASPGYIVPRIQALAMNEAARMVEEGVATAEDIDKATKYGFGFRFTVLGLLEFIDWGGGDILYYATRYMSQAMNSDRFSSPAIVEQNMKDGHTGLRDRQGFLDYSELDIPAYQRQRLSEFVAMLRHLEKLPRRGPG